MSHILEKIQFNLAINADHWLSMSFLLTSSLPCWNLPYKVSICKRVNHKVGIIFFSKTIVNLLIVKWHCTWSNILPFDNKLLMFNSKSHFWVKYWFPIFEKESFSNWLFYKKGKQFDFQNFQQSRPFFVIYSIIF